jgi:hypothetical protein
VFDASDILSFGSVFGVEIVALRRTDFETCAVDFSRRPANFDIGLAHGGFHQLIAVFFFIA